MQETSFDGLQNSNKIEEYAHRLTFLLVFIDHECSDLVSFS
jgi:hypothetical protein